MGTKHTPGPWSFDDLEMKIKGTGDVVIANVSPKMDYSPGMRTQTANAKLIAAAPELLVAITELCDDFGLRIIALNNPNTTLFKAWNKACYAIKNATE